MISKGFASSPDGDVGASGNARSLQHVTDSVLDALAQNDVPLLAGASGAAVVFQARTRLIGVTPPTERILSIVRQLEHRAEAIDGGAPDALPGELSSPASGTLVFAIDSEAGEYVLWFSRREAPVAAIASNAPESREALSLWSAADRRLAAKVTYSVVLKIKRQVSELVGRMHEEQQGRARACIAIGHELRNSLGILVGWTDVLRTRSSGAEQHARAIDVIERGIRIQRKLVHDLVETSMHGLSAIVLDYDEVQVLRLVQDMLDACRPALEAKQLRVEVQLDPELGVVRGDAERLGQVLGNVLANAVKFTPPAGVIRVAVRRSERHIEISVSDTGLGISSDFLPHVFEPFRQEDPSSKRSHGLGLGLTIAKQLVELHGGQISAESAGTGAGATFRILLPA